MDRNQCLVLYNMNLILLVNPTVIGGTIQPGLTEKYLSKLAGKYAGRKIIRPKASDEFDGSELFNSLSLAKYMIGRSGSYYNNRVIYELVTAAGFPVGRTSNSIHPIFNNTRDETFYYFLVPNVDAKLQCQVFKTPGEVDAIEERTIHANVLVMLNGLMGDEGAQEGFRKALYDMGLKQTSVDTIRGLYEGNPYIGNRELNNIVTVLNLPEPTVTGPMVVTGSTGGAMIDKSAYPLFQQTLNQLKGAPNEDTTTQLERAYDQLLKSIPTIYPAIQRLEDKLNEQTKKVKESTQKTANISKRMLNAVRKNGKAPMNVNVTEVNKAAKIAQGTTETIRKAENEIATLGREIRQLEGDLRSARKEYLTDVERVKLAQLQDITVNNKSVSKLGLILTKYPASPAKDEVTKQLTILENLLREKKGARGQTDKIRAINTDVKAATSALTSSVKALEAAEIQRLIAKLESLSEPVQNYAAKLDAIAADLNAIDKGAANVQKSLNQSKREVAKEVPASQIQNISKNALNQTTETLELLKKLENEQKQQEAQRAAELELLDKQQVMIMKGMLLQIFKADVGKNKLEFRDPIDVEVTSRNLSAYVENAYLNREMDIPSGIMTVGRNFLSFAYQLTANARLGMCMNDLFYYLLKSK